MKTIKLFLASSEELKDDRVKFGDFINDLNWAFKPNGIDFELVKWEYLDSAYNGRCKEGEYILEVKKCQLFVALFHTIGGKYTKEELDAALKSSDLYAVPKIYIFVKDLTESEIRTADLLMIMKEMQNELCGFNDTYDNLNTLKLRFLSQLLVYLNDPSIRVEVKNSTMRINGIPLANVN